MERNEYKVVLEKLTALTEEHGLELGILNFLNKLLELKHTKPNFRFTSSVLDREIFSNCVYLELDEFDEYSRGVLKEYCSLYPNSILENLCGVLPEAYYNITGKDNLESFIKKIYDTL